MSVVQKLASGTWRRYSADDGGYYFHNEENDQSVWDPPQGWVEDSLGGPGAMDQLSAEGKTVPRSSSQLSSVVGEKPNRPSHTREASQDTMMSPGEVQSMKREAQGSSVSVATPVVRQQQQQQPKSSSYDNNREQGESSPLCGCLGACNLCWCCGVVGIIIAVLAIVVLSVVLTLPQTVSCNAGDEGYFVVVYDGPKITSVTPNIVCTATPSNVTFKGSGFVNYGGNTPQVTLGSWSLSANSDSMLGCDDVSVRKQDVQTCTEFTVQLPSDDGTNKPDALLTVTNPSKNPHPAAKQSSACNFVSSTTLLLVRAPNVTAVNPPGVCEKTVGTITIVGGSFFSYQLTNTSDWVKPSITLPTTGIPPDAITPSTCTYYSPTGYNNASTCQQLVVQLTSSLYSAMNTFTVKNPSINGGCDGGQAAIFRVIPPSTVTSAEPNVLCWRAGPTPVTLYGTFMEIDSQGPIFSFAGGNTEDGTITMTNLLNCTILNATAHIIRQCAIATVIIDPADRTTKNTTYYVPSLLVDNRIPGCVGASTPIATFPDPIIDPTPYGLPALCSTGPIDQTVIVSGSFLVFNGSKPTVRVGPLTFDPSRVNPLLCNPIGVPGPTVSLCSRLSLTILNATVIAAPNSVNVTYPAPLQTCTSISSYSIFQANEPTVASVTPTTVILANLPINLTIAGTFQVWNSATVPNVRVGNTVQRTVFALGCSGGPPQTCTGGLNVTLTSSTGLSGANNAVIVETGSCTDQAPQTITFV